MVKIIAEIGINHNGSIDICKHMMLMAKNAGVDYVKIQKRTPELCVPDDQKNKPKDTPWGNLIGNESHEIFKSRNYFVFDSNIKKYMQKHTKYIQKELNKLNSYFDNPECYTSTNKYIYVLIVNPTKDFDRYEVRNGSYDFWKPVYKLYNNNSRTYLKVIMKEKYKKYSSYLL